MINKVSIACGYNNYKTTDSAAAKPNNSSPITTDQDTLVKSQVSFNGLGSALLRVGDLFRKSPKTTEEAIKLLEQQANGAYVLLGNRYVYRSTASAQTMKAKEAIIKQPLYITKSHYAGITEKSQCREGITPSSIISFLERGYEKVTMIADNGIQRLTLPKDAKERKIANISLVNYGIDELKTQADIGYITPEGRAAFLFKLAKEMIEGDSNIKLELFAPIAKKVIKTAEEVLKLLEKEEYGAYILKDGQFVPHPIDEVMKSGAKEIVIKQQAHEVELYQGRQRSVESYRIGFTPRFIMECLKTNLEKITVVADNGIQTLILPKSAQEKNSARGILLSYGVDELKSQIDVREIMPKSKAKFLFDLSEELVDGVPSIKLELSPPQKS